MGLAGKDEDDGLTSLFQDAGQTVHIGEQQGRTLVGGQSGGQSRSPGSRASGGTSSPAAFVGYGEFFEEFRKTGAEGFQQVLFLGLPGHPEVGIGNVRDAGPVLVFGLPVPASLPPDTFAAGGAWPARRRMAHGRRWSHGRWGSPPPGHPASPPATYDGETTPCRGADAVGLHGILEGQDGHLEDVAFAAFKAAHVDQGLPADAHGLDIGLEIGLHAFQRKRSLPASTGVWVVNRVLPRTTFAGFFEGQAVFLHQQADALEDEEGRMPPRSCDRRQGGCPGRAACSRRPGPAGSPAAGGYRGPASYRRAVILRSSAVLDGRLVSSR